MKSILFIFTFLSVAAHADFQAYRVAPCMYWMPNYSGSGFVCQNIPNTILVPQAESVAEIIKIQNEKIKNLEERLKKLEDSNGLRFEDSKN